MTKPKDDPTEQLLDLLVYAPLGLLFEARDLVPRLAEKGRQRMGGQVTVARMVGEMAVRQGQRRAEKLFERLREQGRPEQTPPFTQPGPRPTNGRGPSAAPAAAPAGPAPSSGPAPPVAPPPPVPAGTMDSPVPAGAVDSPVPAGAVDSSALAIPGYDTLSASQVVPRLEGLSSDELEAVRVYEQATRARKTVLTRIDQLRRSA